MSSRPEQSRPRKLARAEDDLMSLLHARDVSLAFLELTDEDQSSFHDWIAASATMAQRRRRMEILAVALNATNPYF